VHDKTPKKKDEKFEQYMKWIKETSDAIDSGLELTGIGDSMEDWQKRREHIKDRKLCIANGKVFVATLDEIEKNKYQLIEDVPITQWGLDFDINDPDLKYRKKIIDNLKTIAIFNIYKWKDGQIPLNMFESKQFTRLYKHDDC
jgi:hypothetical protein